MSTWTCHDPPETCACVCHQLERAKAENEALRRERDEAREDLRFRLASIIQTIGGTDEEGNPTSSVNYLQRLRALVAVESALAAERARGKVLEEQARDERKRVQGMIAALREQAGLAPDPEFDGDRLVHELAGAIGRMCVCGFCASGVVPSFAALAPAPTAPQTGGIRPVNLDHLQPGPQQEAMREMLAPTAPASEDVRALTIEECAKAIEAHPDFREWRFHSSDFSARDEARLNGMKQAAARVRALAHGKGAGR